MRGRFTGWEPQTVSTVVAIYFVVLVVVLVTVVAFATCGQTMEIG